MASPDTIILLIVDYHTAIVGKTPVAILAYAAGAMNRPRQRLPRDDIHRVTVEIDAEQQPVEEH